MLHASPVVGADFATGNRFYQPISSTSPSTGLVQVDAAATPATVSLRSLMDSTGPAALPDLYQSSEFLNSSVARMGRKHHQQQSPASNRPRNVGSDGFVQPYPPQPFPQQHHQAQGSGSQDSLYAPSSSNYHVRSQSSGAGVGSFSAGGSAFGPGAGLGHPGRAGMALDPKSPGMSNALFSPSGSGPLSLRLLKRNSGDHDRDHEMDDGRIQGLRRPASFPILSLNDDSSTSGSGPGFAPGTSPMTAVSPLYQASSNSGPRPQDPSSSKRIYGAEFGTAPVPGPVASMSPPPPGQQKQRGMMRQYHSSMGLSAAYDGGQAGYGDYGGGPPPSGSNMDGPSGTIGLGVDIPFGPNSALGGESGANLPAPSSRRPAFAPDGGGSGSSSGYHHDWRYGPGSADGGGSGGAPSSAPPSMGSAPTNAYPLHSHGYGPQYTHALGSNNGSVGGGGGGGGGGGDRGQGSRAGFFSQPSSLASHDVTGSTSSSSSSSRLNQPPPPPLLPAGAAGAAPRSGAPASAGPTPTSYKKAPASASASASASALAAGSAGSGSNLDLEAAAVDTLRRQRSQPALLSHLSSQPQSQFQSQSIPHRPPHSVSRPPSSLDVESQGRPPSQVYHPYQHQHLQHHPLLQHSHPHPHPPQSHSPFAPALPPPPPPLSLAGTMSDIPRNVDHRIKDENGQGAPGYARGDRGEGSSTSLSSWPAPSNRLINSTLAEPTNRERVVIPPDFTSIAIKDETPLPERPPPPPGPPGVTRTDIRGRANLTIGCNVNEMAVGWNQEEWHNGRRLVRFHRRQRGTDLDLLCEAIPAHWYNSNDCVVSCIYSEDKNECFITSVDLLSLLETILQTRFTIEEKNRIRRNLEGFHPITLSKTKPETEGIFKQIMAFNNPKPRNIEKDVKVFLWKTVPESVKKITGKYLAVGDHFIFIDELTAVGKESNNHRGETSNNGGRVSRPNHRRTASLGSVAPYPRTSSHHPRTAPIREAMTVANTPALPALSTGLSHLSMSPVATQPSFHYGGHAEARNTTTGLAHSQSVPLFLASAASANAAATSEAAQQAYTTMSPLALSALAESNHPAHSHYQHYSPSLSGSQQGYHGQQQQQQQQPAPQALMAHAPSSAQYAGGVATPQQMQQLHQHYAQHGGYAQPQAMHLQQHAFYQPLYQGHPEQQMQGGNQSAFYGQPLYQHQQAPDTDTAHGAEGGAVVTTNEQDQTLVAAGPNDLYDEHALTTANLEAANAASLGHGYTRRP